MKTLIWILLALFALLWTAAAWGTAELVQWAVGALAGGVHGSIDPAQISLRIPPWLEPWIDMGWLLAMLDSVGTLLGWLRGVWPHAAQAAGWLVPLVWVGWGLGMLLMLALALGLHLALRVATPRPVAVSPGPPGAA